MPTTSSLALCLVAALSAACSQRYGTGEFLNGQELVLDAVQSQVLYEGLGDLPVVVVGRGITADAELTVVLPSGEALAPSSPSAVSNDGTLIARVFHLPVWPEADGTKEAEVTVTQPQSGGDPTVQVVGAQVVMLPELDLCPEEDGCTVDVTSVSELYSEITLHDNEVRFVGDEVAVLRATGNVKQVSTRDFAVVLNVSAVPFPSPESRPGPGGCAGGAPGQPGECASGGPAGEITGCPIGGGRAGGGGGGHANGSTPPDFGLGAPSGSRWLVPFTDEVAGGGGGAVSVAGCPASGGGHGGGSLALFAGSMSTDSGVWIEANGASGLPASSDCDTPSTGGGGAAGSIMVRLRNGFSPQESGLDPTTGVSLGRFSLDFGRVSPAGLPCGQGVIGAPGRLRIDMPPFLPGNLDLPLQGFVRGPTLSSNTRLFGEPTAEILVTGTANVPLPLYRNGEHLGDLSLLTSPAFMSFDLVPGHNELCLYAAPDLDRSLEEAGSCISVAYIPQAP